MDAVSQGLSVQCLLLPTGTFVPIPEQSVLWLTIEAGNPVAGYPCLRQLAAAEPYSAPGDDSQG